MTDENAITTLCEIKERLKYAMPYMRHTEELMEFVEALEVGIETLKAHNVEKKPPNVLTIEKIKDGIIINYENGWKTFINSDIIIPQIQTRVSYICKERYKGKVCPGTGALCSYETCHHTTDVKYAKNFAEVSNDEYAELDTWMPLPGIKPKPYRDVIFCDIDGCIYKGSIYDNGKWYDDNYDDPVKNVVAWMPLPESYKKEGEE